MKLGIIEVKIDNIIEFLDNYYLVWKVKLSLTRVITLQKNI